MKVALAFIAGVTVAASVVNVVSCRTWVRVAREHPDLMAAVAIAGFGIGIVVSRLF